MRARSIDAPGGAASAARRSAAVEPLISHEFELAEAPAAIAYAIEHPAEVMKALVHTG